jgi:hypothetical protein
MIIPTDRSKIIQIDYGLWSLAGDYPVCITLTRRDIVAIYAQLEFLEWRTRWVNIPDNFNQKAYAKDLQERILTQMECWDCEDTIACILEELASGTTLASAIKNALAGIGFPPDYPYLPFDKGIPIPESIREIESPVPFCNLNVLWGACISVVNNLADLMEDFMQEVEAEGSQAKIILKVLDAIPALGAFVDETAVADIYEFTQALKTELVNSYLAGDDIARRTEIACELFCICIEKCSVSFADVGQAFSNLNVLALTDPFDIIQIITALQVGSLPNDLVFVGMLQLALVSVQTGNFFNGLFGGENFNKFVIEEGFDEPSSDHTIFCTDCPSDQWEIEFDFLVSDQDFTPYSGGQYLTGEGFAPTFAGGSFGGFSRDFGLTTVITSYELKIVGLVGASPGGLSQVFPQDVIDQFAPPDGDSQVFNPISAFEMTKTGLGFFLFNGAAFYDYRIEKLIVRGNGTPLL